VETVSTGCFRTRKRGIVPTDTKTFADMVAAMTSSTATIPFALKNYKAMDVATIADLKYFKDAFMEHNTSFSELFKGKKIKISKAALESVDEVTGVSESFADFLTQPVFVDYLPELPTSGFLPVSDLHIGDFAKSLDETVVVKKSPTHDSVKPIVHKAFKAGKVYFQKSPIEANFKVVEPSICPFCATDGDHICDSLDMVAGYTSLAKAKIAPKKLKKTKITPAVEHTYQPFEPVKVQLPQPTDVQVVRMKAEFVLHIVGTEQDTHCGLSAGQYNGVADVLSKQDAATSLHFFKEFFCKTCITKHSG
jgi:hypothetical protein